ncbi:MAG: acetyl-CoA carboxylase biotin carboxylase subunit, partial [Pseudomonadota bacterium]
VIEEAPAPDMPANVRAAMGQAAVEAAQAIGYQGAGTVEFIVDGSGPLREDGFWFMEMNTRLQVEHPVTEAITGVDLVREQIRIADGKPLSVTQDELEFRGHAIECRINAEHHETFVPSPGKITDFHAPGGPDVRLDSAVYAGYKIPPHYDSMIAKLIVHGRTRNECIMRLRRALDEMVVGGVDTTLPLHRKLVEAQDVIDGNYDIHWLERFLGLK